MTSRQISLTAMSLQILLAFQLLHKVSMNLFQPVSSSCIYWESLSLYSYGETDKLHCILDETGHPGIVNTTWKLVEPGLCPYFDRHSSEINMKQCDAESGKCPDRPIYSFQAVKYSACFGAVNRNESNVNKSTSETSSAPSARNRKEGYSIVVILIVAILVVQLLILGLQIHEKIHRNRGLIQKTLKGNAKLDWSSPNEECFYSCRPTFASEDVDETLKGTGIKPRKERFQAIRIRSS